MTSEGYGRAYQCGFEHTIRFLLSRGIQRDNAKEFAQAAWVRGWERLAQLRDESLVVTWVNSIALNVHRSVIRKESLHQDLLGMADKTTMIDLAVIDADRILNFCRPRDRILLEQYMCGITTREIAQKLGVTETAIRIRLLRARRDARARIERRPGAACSKRNALTMLDAA